MWDFGFAIPSFIIILIITCFYFSLPRLSIKKNHFFFLIMVVECLVICINILSTWACEKIDELPLALVDFLNVGFFVLFYAQALTFFVFVASVFMVLPEKADKVTILIHLPFFAASAVAISSPWTGLVYSFKTGSYVSGPMYDLIYVVFGIYLIMSYFVIIKYRNKVRRRRHYISMIGFVGAITAGIVLRKVYPQVLLMDTFSLIAILIVYLASENPEYYLEPRGAVFNSTAFRDYIDEHNGKLKHRILGLVVKNYYEMRDVYGGRQMDAGLVLICHYLTQTYKDLNVFYYRKGRFILLGKSDMDYRKYISALKSRFKSPWAKDGLELYLEPGFACVDFGQNVESADVLLNSLITAFDKVDGHGSDEVLYFTEDEIKSNENEKVLKRYLDDAVDNDKLEVFLQPVFDAKSGTMVGAESLCRIRDDKGDLIMPESFIHLAEANGRINKLGEQVFEKVCRFICGNDMRKLGLSWINVNLSPVQFLRSDLAYRYEAIAAKYNINPDIIHLEITESSMIDEGFLHRQINAMRVKGFNFALDDYGVGYSNLSRLKKCPFTNVKLDMSIVWEYYKNPDEILPSMIKAFKHMGFSVTAEGIEDEKINDMMKSIGCDYLQGYYYSKPLTMDEFIARYS